jgi:hypothetical protein
VNALSSIPFEEADPIDHESQSFPGRRAALSVGASLLALWIGPLIMVLSAMTSRRRGAHDPIPDAAPVHQSRALPHIQAA